MQDTITTTWFDAINKRNADGLTHLYSDDALIHSKKGPVKGKQALVEIMERWDEAMPDFKVQPVFATTEDDVVVVHWHATGTFKKPLLSMEPTHKQTSFHGVTCFKCKDGQVVEHWATTDYRAMTI